MADADRNLPSPQELQYKNELDLSRSIGANAAAGGGRIAPITPLQQNLDASMQPGGSGTSQGTQREAPSSRIAAGIRRTFGPGRDEDDADADGAVDAAGALLSGDIGASRGALVKVAIDKYVWPLLLDPTGVVSFFALTFLQLYAACSLVKFGGTVRMKLWQYGLIGVLSLIELFIILIALEMLAMLACLARPSCTVSFGWQIFKSVLK